MPQSLGGKDHRVAIDLLLEVFAGLFCDGLAIRAGFRAAIGAAKIRGHIAPTMGSADLNSGKAIESSLEDQMGERHGRLQRIADYISQKTVSLKPPLAFRKASRVDENQDSELLGLSPEGS